MFSANPQTRKVLSRLKESFLSGEPLLPLPSSGLRRRFSETGIKVIDLLAPYPKGGKVGLFGGAGVGKTVLIMELIHNIANPNGRLFCLCRGRGTHQEGNELWRSMQESGVLERTALVFGQMNEPPGARLLAALTGLTMAEYFRDSGRRRCAFLHRQHLPLMCRRLGSFCPVGKNALAVGYQTHFGYRNGHAAGADCPPPRTVPSLPFKLSTSLQTTTLIRHL